MLAPRARGRSRRAVARLADRRKHPCRPRGRGGPRCARGRAGAASALRLPPRLAPLTGPRAADRAAPRRWCRLRAAAARPDPAHPSGVRAPRRRSRGMRGVSPPPRPGRRHHGELGRDGRGARRAPGRPGLPPPMRWRRSGIEPPTPRRAAARRGRGPISSASARSSRARTTCCCCTCGATSPPAGGTAAPRLVLVGRRGWENENILDLLDRCTLLRGLVEEAGPLPDDAGRAAARRRPAPCCSRASPRATACRWPRRWPPARR